MKTSLLAVASAVALAIGSIAGCSTTTPRAADNPVVKRQAIDADVEAALARLYAQDPSARELVTKARGTLVFPSVVSAGFVVGGSYGQGALRVRGRTSEYYSTAAGSVGLLAGAESKSVFLLFMTDDVVKAVQVISATLGTDAAALVNVAPALVDSKTVQQAVIGYVMTKGGLMANVSLEGTKITPLAI
jgi:lipid-binding SYLF domain-containing protein